MGVYIDGMEMPTSCESCPCKTADAFGGLGCQATGYIPLRKANQDRPDNCPLVSVPPHGRLGDLDELHKEAVRRAEKTGTYDSWYNCTDRVISAFDIKNAPTIIPASEEGE